MTMPVCLRARFFDTVSIWRGDIFRWMYRIDLVFRLRTATEATLLGAEGVRVRFIVTADSWTEPSKQHVHGFGRLR